MRPVVLAALALIIVAPAFASRPASPAQAAAISAAVDRTLGLATNCRLPETVTISTEAPGWARAVPRKLTCASDVRGGYFVLLLIGKQWTVVRELTGTPVCGALPTAVEADLTRGCLKGGHRETSAELLR